MVQYFLNELYTQNIPKFLILSPFRVLPILILRRLCSITLYRLPIASLITFSEICFDTNPVHQMRVFSIKDQETEVKYISTVIKARLQEQMYSYSFFLSFFLFLWGGGYYKLFILNTSFNLLHFPLFVLNTLITFDKSFTWAGLQVSFKCVLL